MIKQIILDMYGTFVPVDGNAILRRGFIDFLNKYADKNIVVFARTPQYIAKEKIDLVGLGEKISLYGLESYIGVYDFNKTVEKSESNEIALKKIHDIISGVEKGKPLPSDLTVPNFLVAKERRVDSVFIGWNYDDISEAIYQNMNQIFQIPLYQDENDTFSFEKIKIDTFSTNFKTNFKKSFGVDYTIKLL